MRKKKTIIIATVKPWNIANALRFRKHFAKSYDVRLLTGRDALNYQMVHKVNPRYIFFPHWSWRIPADIYNNFECVVFHMTDLPFGRGGSPLQNLILKGKRRTKISALRVNEEMDGGPVYIKRPMALNGSARDIYKRASGIIFCNMIPYIIKNNLFPLPQSGKAVLFKRRKPQDSRIPRKIKFCQVYDFIRMLDAEDYPRAFIETDNLRFEFEGALKSGNKLYARVLIKNKE